MRRKFTQWKDEKGFGFIVSEDNGEKIFFHISVVKSQGRRPKVDDVVLYDSVLDPQGRLKAKAVVIEGLDPLPNTNPAKQIHTAPPSKDALDFVAIVLLIGSLVNVAYYFIHSGDIVNLIPAGFIIVVAVVLLNRQKKPKEKRFSCTRCRKIADHDKRTIRAWNNGFLKLYCNVCHQQWLANQSIQAAPSSNESSGCLGVSVLLVILPIVAAAGAFHWLA